MSEIEDLEAEIAAKVNQHVEDANTETQVATEAVETEVKPVEEIERSEKELKAIDLGWKPKDQLEEDFDGDYVSADEFLRRGELFDKISRQGKEVRELKSALQTEQKERKDAEIRAYKQAIEDVSASKRTAVEEGDIDVYNSLELRERELNKQMGEIKPVPDVNPVNDAVNRFKERNDWFTTDIHGDSEEAFKSMYVVQRWDHYVKVNPNLSVDDAIEKIETDVNKRFKAVNERRSAPSAVESSGRPKSKAKAASMDELNDYQKQLCKAFVDAKLGTTEDYIKQRMADKALTGV